MNKNINKFIQHCIDTRTIRDLQHAFYVQLNGYGKDCKEFKLDTTEWLYGVRIAIKKLKQNNKVDISVVEYYDAIKES